MRRALQLSWLLVMGGCVLSDVPLEGLECPCAEGWYCQEGICIEGEFRCGRESEPTGSLVLDALRVEWVTPNQARLVWNVDDPASVFSYELDVDTDRSALQSGPGERVVGIEDNPEFARAFLEGATDIVDRTTVRELEEDTAYWMRVVARDASGGVSCSAPVAVRTATAPLAPPISLYDESHPGGDTLPTCMRVIDDEAASHVGERHYAWDVECRAVCPLVDGMRPDDCATRESVAACPGEYSDPRAPSCYENLRIRSLGQAAPLSPAGFRAAYLEMWIAIDESPVGGWGEIGIRNRVGSDTRYHALRRASFVADGAYHRYQVPLSVLDPALPLAQDGSADLSIASVRFGTLFRDGTRVRIDGAAIRR